MQTEVVDTQRACVVTVAILRGGVVLQGIGIGQQRLGMWGEFEDESPVFGLLMYDWGWPEAVAQSIDDIGAWLYFVSGLALAMVPLCGALLRRGFRRDPWLPVWAWQAPLCLIVAIWQAIQIVVSWYRGGYFMSEWTLASESARFALPVVLLTLTPGPWSGGISPRRLLGGIWILRAAAALTFLAHGLKAYHLAPAFTDYLIVAGDRIGWEISQAGAETVLAVIGVLDITLAFLILVVQWRSVAFYMAAWALIGAVARIVHTGWDAHYEVLIRAGNYCVPLIVGLFWHLSRPRASKPDSHEE